MAALMHQMAQRGQVYVTNYNGKSSGPNSAERRGTIGRALGRNIGAVLARIASGLAAGEISRESLFGEFH